MSTSDTDTQRVAISESSIVIARDCEPAELRPNWHFDFFARPADSTENKAYM